jgi:hypothetical protein
VIIINFPESRPKSNFPESRPGQYLKHVAHGLGERVVMFISCI